MGIMNHHAMLLDCTLRDGAYLVDKKFGENNIYGIIEGLMKAKIDCIEIGFFQNEGFGEGKTVYRNSADAKKYIPKDKEGSIFTVLADCISCSKTSRSALKRAPISRRAKSRAAAAAAAAAARASR